jgi:argininosuccinate synthase
MSAVAHRPRPALPRLSQEKAYSTDANIWGATHEAKTLEHLDDLDGDRRADHGREVLGPDSRRHRHRGRDDHLRPGSAGRRSTARLRLDPVALVMEANTIGGRHGLGMSRPDREPHHRGQEPRHLRGPGMALLFIAYERLLNAIHNEDTIANYHSRAAASAGCSTRAAGSTRRPDAARVAAALGRLGRHRRGHSAAAPRRRLLHHRHPRPGLLYHPDKLSMERTEDAAFGPIDRIGQLTMRNLDIADTRSKLELYAASRCGATSVPPPCSRWRPTTSGTGRSRPRTARGWGSSPRRACPRSWSGSR